VSPWTLAICALACLLLRLLLSGRRVDVTGLVYAFGPLNSAAFALRRKLGWSRGRVSHANESKDDLFAHAGDAARELEKRERSLRRRYDLQRLHRRSSREVYRENVYLLDLLDRHVDAGLLGQQLAVRAVDVGSKDFRYASALARWLQRSGAETPREVSLTGIELDGHPIYADLHARKDHGEAYAREVDGADVRYAVKDFLAHAEGEVDVVFLFFPFVLEYALLRWGLPRSFFLPARIVRHAHEMLRRGGLVVVMNHTEAERRRQVELLSEAGFEILGSNPATNGLVDWAADVPERSLTVARRR
jgi:hypothetical protein